MSARSTALPAATGLNSSPARLRAAQRIADKYAKHPGRGGCGIGALADPKGASRELVDLALAGLSCVEHRGGGIEDTGDGAGLLLALHRPFFERFIAHGKRLPERDVLGAGMVFFPHGEGANAPPIQARIDALLRRNGLAPLGWRRVPVDPSVLGEQARASMREPWQLLVGQGMLPPSEISRAYFRVKAEIERQFPALYVASLQPRAIVYKALATGPQLARYFKDLQDPLLASDLITFHRRYSTNTLSNWALAQPFRLLAHNGEINTIKANRSALQSLERELSLGGLLMQPGSDSADLDRAVELFSTHGVSLPETLLRLMPAAWKELDDDAGGSGARFARGVQRALGTIAAWEGPAGVVASDGEVLVAALDRMGLRPLRWLRTKGGRFVVESELGAVPIALSDIAETGQLDPGEMIAFTPRQGELGVLETPSELRRRIARTTRLNTEDLAERELRTVPTAENPAPAALPEKPLALFGWSADRVKTARFMATEGKEPIVGMGYDRPLAIFSKGRPPLFRYFKQTVAVVTNPPIDPIREGGAFDLTVHLGAVPSAHEDHPVYDPHPQFRLSSPLLTSGQLLHIAQSVAEPKAVVLDTTIQGPADGAKLSEALAALGRAAVQVVRAGVATVVVLSDRRAVQELALTDVVPMPNPITPGEAGGERLPMPMLLAVAAVHNALTAEGLRRACSIVADSGEVEEGHDACVLIANGATAVCPWLLLRVATAHSTRDPAPNPVAGAVPTLLKALDGTIKRVMSKMGICTVDGYRGARLFEAIGLAPELVDYYLPGVPSRVGGIGLHELADDVNARAAEKVMQRSEDSNVYRKEIWHDLQLAAKGEDKDAYVRFVRKLEETPPVYLRDVLKFRHDADARITLDEVMKADDLVAQTFRGAAMSHGSLHRTAHRAIAAAFNELGALSNCGEGGEDVRRNRGGEHEHCRSRIRQVASGRFGVDAAYLVNADELEIKIGQGAKPGEGGHLPAEKVTAEIAAIRRTRQGVSLISPPPHHDIYSIEDLAQLIASLRAVNPRARISVKCPAVSDLGTIAVGVAKAGADVIAISGFEGGTGAANASSIEHAGLPLELGLTDAHQALVVNGVRDSVILRADGGIKTGADVAKLLALGADAVSLGTALMIAEQCIYCHGCSKGNCPAGITTSDDQVGRRLMQPKTSAARALQVIAEPDPVQAEEERFLDAKQGVQRYLRELAEDVRRHLAALGLRSTRELVGRVDLLEQIAPADHDRAARVDLSGLLADLAPFAGRKAKVAIMCAPSTLEEQVLAELAQGKSEYTGAISTSERSFGARISGEVAAGRVKLGENTKLSFEGCAGQGFGFALVQGLSLSLRGYANDTVAEVMSGGRVSVLAPRNDDSGKSLIGNAAAYGATGGELFVSGRVGQRFGVRNSGASLVCEGAGKYAFEYMTGGVGVVLGPLGRAAASGMTGGELFLLCGLEDVDDTVLRTRVHADAKLVAVDDAAEERLVQVLSTYEKATQSPIAQKLLSEREKLKTRFLRAIPAS
ncbi:MAG: alpha-hydroxy-acid oxidizing protein [Deltaproteobacteria bacterium]|nr:alpha-hydroxy-acid oxidizing protein [Deltaproteobacteria bacterium]